MNKKVIKFLESLGFVNVIENTQESTSKALRFFGEDDRGLFLEFQYTPSDGYIFDRSEGSKYWDYLAKL